MIDNDYGTNDYKYSKISIGAIKKNPVKKCPFVIKKLCNKAVNIYTSTMQFVPECYKTQEMCGEAVNRFFFGV